MAEVLQPYSVQRFNAIPDIYDAQVAFAAKDGRAFVDAVFVPLVKKHGLEEKVGLGLLHRHFVLEEGEKLVELNNTSTPWTVDEDEVTSPVGGQILPIAFLIQDGKLMPYEFYFIPMSREPTFKSVDLTDLTIQAFLKDFVQAVKDADLDAYVSLRVCPEGDFDQTLEVTQSKSNVNLPKGQYDPDSLKGATTTMWFARNGEGPQPLTWECTCYVWVGASHSRHGSATG